ncbi:MAG: class I SAM-dependent methyltransferase, partial [Nocardioides sp.]
MTSSTLTIAQAINALMRDGLPLRFTAYDGSSAGPPGAELGLELTSRRGLAYLLTSPGDLGMARAYVSGDLVLHGVHPGDPYDALVHLQSHLRFRAPTPTEALAVVRSLGIGNLRPPPPPPEESVPRWRRTVDGLRHTKGRDAGAISHHYDVSNRFYELVLGPSMTYT